MSATAEHALNITIITDQEMQITAKLKLAPDGGMRVSGTAVATTGVRTLNMSLQNPVPAATPSGVTVLDVFDGAVDGFWVSSDLADLAYTAASTPPIDNWGDTAGKWVDQSPNARNLSNTGGGGIATGLIPGTTTGWVQPFEAAGISGPVGGATSAFYLAVAMLSDSYFSGRIFGDNSELKGFFANYDGNTGLVSFSGGISSDRVTLTKLNPEGTFQAIGLACLEFWYESSSLHCRWDKGAVTSLTCGAVAAGLTNLTIGDPAGPKYVEVLYTKNSVPSATLRDLIADTFMARIYSATPKVATPTFTPAAGSYNAPITVGIATTTAGSNIRYTTDSSTPTSAVGTLFSSAFVLTANAQVRAIAYKDGFTDSNVATADYVVTNKVATPTFNPVAGSYAGTQLIEISTVTTGATIHYNVGTPAAPPANPTTASTVYTNTVNVPASAVIKAIGVKAGISDSDVATAEYTISTAGSVPVIQTPLSSNPNIELQVGDPAEAHFVENNTWGSSGMTFGTAANQYEQYVGRSLTVGASNEVAYELKWRWPNPAGSSEVKGFPQIITGRKPGYFGSGSLVAGSIPVILPDGSTSTLAPSGHTPGTFFPLQLGSANLANVRAKWKREQVAAYTGAGQLTWDIWLQSNSTQDFGFASSSITHEIMIPLENWGGYGAHPTGRNSFWYDHDVVLEGRLYHVYATKTWDPNGPNHGSLLFNFGGLNGTYGRFGWKMIAFVPDVAMATVADINLGTIVNYVATRTDVNGNAWATGAEYMVSAELGVEPHEGTGDIIIHDYRVYIDS